MSDVTEYQIPLAEDEEVIRSGFTVAVSSCEGEKALGIIRNEHISLALVLIEMDRVVSEVRMVRTAVDCSLLWEMLDYIKNFIDKLHHPKEDLYLFARLRQRTHAVDQEIAELQESHAAGGGAMARLEHSLRKLGDGTSQAIEAFCVEFDRFSQEQWLHMHLEESVVFRAAEKYLLQTDWEEIAAAFGQNGDPHFGSGSDEALQEKYSKIADSLARGAYITSLT